MIKKYQATQKLLDAISSEPFERSKVSAKNYYGEWYEVLIGIGKNYSISIMVDEETIENNPDYFKEITNET